MNKMKKFASIATAVLMTACMAAPMTMSLTSSAAATAGKISFTGETTGTHAYTAYKIFSGEAEANGFGSNAKLNNINWAISDTDATTFLDKLKADANFNTADKNDFEGCTTAASVAEVLAGYNSNSAKAKAFANIVVANKLMFTGTSSVDGVISISDDGYYVIEETSLTDGGTMTAYLLGVYDTSAGAEVTVKSSMPQFQKKLKDTNDSTGLTTDWQDSADYDINDTVPFQLKATLPDTYDTYNTYKLVFHDDLNKNADGKDVFTLNEDSFVVYADLNGDGSYSDGEAFSNTEYSLITSVTGTHDTGFNCDFEVTLTDIKKSSLKDSITKSTPIYVEYNATLNENAVLGSAGNWNDAYLEYSNNPNYGGTGNTDTETTSKTPEDTVVVFTYKTIVDKVDKDGNPLTGAEFKLEKEIKGETENTWKEIAVVKSADGCKFTFTGLDDGNYRLTETKKPNGYKSIDPILFTVAAEHITDGDKSQLELTSLSGNVTEGSINMLDLVNEHGVKDTANPNDNTYLNSDVDEGSLSGKVINTSGAELPSTGGIGTTLFYVGGGAMVAVAGVFLITKKRMGRKED